MNEMLALTHLPSPNLESGQRTHVARVPLDYGLAVRQHAAYCQTLRDCGATIHTLEVNRDLPDSTFLEDTAVVLDEVAVLASMGTAARRAEPAGVEAELRKYRPLARIEPPATLEGGDVLRVGQVLLVGVSARTDAAGAGALQAVVRPYGYRVLPVPVRGCLHLKTACTALPDGALLVNPAWVDLPSLRGFATVCVPEGEPWAANTLAIGGTVCLAAGHDQTADLLSRRGFDVRVLDLSEFAKAEGGVTCLSLLLDPG
jgi:dimethylargininase